MIINSSEIMNNRIIGKYVGNAPGPLLVITAAMHGNEPAGVKALDLLFKMLEVEPITNPDFTYHGEIIGLIGNLSAFNNKKRFIQKDINRSWFPLHIDFIKSANKASLKDEDLEMREILDILIKELSETHAEKLYLLDLHTTSSDGIFCIATNEIDSIKIGHEIHAPVILGLLNGIEGTSLHYFNQNNTGLPTTSIAFEGGHHDDPLSINRCIAATLNFMRSIGVVRPRDIENRHDQILKDYTAKLPQIVEVFYRFHVEDNDKWKMENGFKNFDWVTKGTFLATYDGQKVLSPFDAFLLMPLYQPQGHDGFFLAHEVRLNLQNG